MKKSLAFALVAGLVGLVGCGEVSKRDEQQVDVTATVTGPDGKPLTKAVIVVLQPTGDHTGSRLEAKADGKFTGKAAPGEYIYYVKHPKSEAPPRGIPAKFTEPNAENKVEVSSGKELTINLAG